MLSFIKKIFGFPTPSEISAAKAAADAAYKIETPLVNNKTGDVVEVQKEPVLTNAVADQAVVTQPAKKTRKPRTPKVEKRVKEKAAKPVKAAAMKVPVKRSKKA